MQTNAPADQLNINFVIISRSVDRIDVSAVSEYIWCSTVRKIRANDRPYDVLPYEIENDFLTLSSLLWQQFVVCAIVVVVVNGPSYCQFPLPFESNLSQGADAE